jgi:diguanylate cyclase (GGDEF)-like protein
MKKLNVNLLTGLVLSIVLLGLVSAVTTFIATRVYRDLTFDFQREYMTQLLAIKATDLLAELEENTVRFGLRVQGIDSFRSAFAARNEMALSAELADQFRQGLVTANVVKAVKLYAYDLEYRLLGSASHDPAIADSAVVICPNLASKAGIREGPNRLTPVSEICLFGNHPYLAVIVPIGGIVPAGYLQVVADPVPALSTMDSVLNMPVTLHLVDGTEVYATHDQKEHWPKNAVISDFMLFTNDSYPALRISAQRQADVLVEKLDRTNSRLIAVVFLIILLTVAMALWFVKYSVFKPLKELSQQLRKGRLGRKHHSDEIPGAEQASGPVSFHALGELYETLRDMAIRDPLTGTYNRALLEDRLKQVIAEHRRTPSTAAVMLIDMVRFKYVNDLLGHHTGDLLLKQIVVRIGKVLRESDTLARLGGDEFTVILPDTDDEQAFQVAEKIIHAMEPDFEIEDHKLSAAVSIGIALTPDHGEDVETLLRHADYAMYSAKKARNSCAIYDPRSSEEINAARMTLNGMLNEDIGRNDLFLVYQPVMDFRTGQVSYIEALVRWRQPDGTIILPGTFIRVAEQSGVIRQLSEWIIETACRELATLQQENPGLRAGINLSMHNLHDYNLTDQIMRSLERYRLQTSSLILEITETGVMMDPDQVIEILGQLSAQGLKLSIDDFGTGHSSLVYLRRLPVHTLKIDKSFVIDMDKDEDNTSIVRATVDLAHNLGLTVTAEGVETGTVCEMLREIGCDYYQGYYVCEPVNAAAIAEWLDNGKAALTSMQVNEESL